jgi:4-hydroxy-tetrahydrodipicolinate reductase
VPVLWAPNFSLGIQVLAELVRLALQRLGPGFDVEIVETHHRGKVDAPSGTAERLASEVRAVRGQMKRTHGREGMVGARASDELAVLSIRGGDVVGDHSVHLFGQGERIELTHRATSRVLFARGALVGARWILGKPPGRHGVSDVVGGGA